MMLRIMSVLAAVLLAGIATAQETFRLDHELAYERVAVLTGDTGSVEEESGIESRLRSETTLNYQNKLPNDHFVLATPSLTLTGFPDERDIDRLEFDLRAEYRLEIDPWSRVQFRGQVQLTYSHDGGREVFNRYRLGAHVRYRHRKENQTFVRLRIGYRNQNEDTFAGFDQSETFLELGHDWRPRNDRFMISGTLYGDIRNAEADRFSSGEIGLRARVRYPVTERLEVTGRFSAYARNYDGPFSDTEPAFRRDRRLQMSVTADYKLTDTLSAFVATGIDRNSSNIDDRDYGGPTLGIGLRLTRRF